MLVLHAPTDLVLRIQDINLTLSGVCLFRCVFNVVGIVVFVWVVVAAGSGVGVLVVVVVRVVAVFWGIVK